MPLVLTVREKGYKHFLLTYLVFFSTFQGSILTRLALSCTVSKYTVSSLRQLSIYIHEKIYSHVTVYFSNSIFDFEISADILIHLFLIIFHFKACSHVYVNIGMHSEEKHS